MKTEMKLNEYCEDCGYFDPIVETQILHANGKFFKQYITITCSYASVCEHLIERMKQDGKNREV